MKEGLEQLYEKRYGTRMPKGEVLKRKIKAKNRRKSKYNGYDDMVEHSSDSDIDFHDMRHTGERKVEMERKQVWANIVKKDIPRVDDDIITFLFFRRLKYFFLLDESYIISCSSYSVR